MVSILFFISPDPGLSSQTQCPMKCVTCQMIAVRAVILGEKQHWEFLWSNFEDALLKRINENQKKINWDYFLACV